MARVKVCRLCGGQNGPDELFCTAADCGASLADVGVVDSSEIGGGAAADGAVHGGAVHGGGEDRRDPPSSADGHTVREGQPPAACALVFPWGRVPVTGQLGIGREAGFSEISGRLDAFPTVSRRHAVVSAARGQWTVRDLGATNGTWVNGTRLAEGETRAIHDGDRVGFSQGLQVQVDLAAAGGTGGGGGSRAGRPDDQLAGRRATDGRGRRRC